MKHNTVNGKKATRSEVIEGVQVEVFNGDILIPMTKFANILDRNRDAYMTRRQSMEIAATLKPSGCMRIMGETGLIQEFEPYYDVVSEAKKIHKYLKTGK